LLAALDVLRDLYTTWGRNQPLRAPTAFLKPTWRKLVGTSVDRRTHEVAVMMTLRDRLRSGDIWVEGSRAFRAFDDFLLPPEIFAARQCATTNWTPAKLRSKFIAATSCAKCDPDR